MVPQAFPLSWQQPALLHEPTACTQIESEHNSTHGLDARQTLSLGIYKRRKWANCRAKAARTSPTDPKTNTPGNQAHDCAAI